MTDRFRPYWARLERGSVEAKTLHLNTREIEGQFVGWGWRITRIDRPYHRATKPSVTVAANWCGVILPQRHSVEGLRKLDLSNLPFAGRCWDWDQVGSAKNKPGRKPTGIVRNSSVVDSLLEMAAASATCTVPELLDLGRRKPLQDEREVKAFFELVIAQLDACGVSRGSLCTSTGYTRQQVATIVKRGYDPAAEDREFRDYIEFRTGRRVERSGVRSRGEITQRQTEICEVAALSWGPRLASPSSLSVEQAAIDERAGIGNDR